MFPEHDPEEFMRNMYEDCVTFDDLTEDELKIQLQSYKMMQKLAEQGKTIWNFDQEWLM
jgi:hypothetical protein